MSVVLYSAKNSKFTHKKHFSSKLHHWKKHIRKTKQGSAYARNVSLFIKTFTNRVESKRCPSDPCG